MTIFTDGINLLGMHKLGGNAIDTSLLNEWIELAKARAVSVQATLNSIPN